MEMELVEKKVEMMQVMETGGYEGEWKAVMEDDGIERRKEEELLPG